MDFLPNQQLQKGVFLVASPDIDAGIFFRSVILLCEHNPMGSFGLVVNKSLDLELPPEVVNLSDLANTNISIRAGGPVQTGQMMLLHTSDKIPQQTLQVCDGVYLGGDLQFLQDSIADEQGPSLLLCFGYTGWGSGQLERELLDGQWFIVPATEEWLFKTPPDALWQCLLRKLGGKYAALAMIPEDLSLN
jgi:Putative transcriptional regulator